MLLSVFNLMFVINSPASPSPVIIKSRTYRITSFIRSALCSIHFRPDSLRDASGFVGGWSIGQFHMKCITCGFSAVQESYHSLEADWGRFLSTGCCGAQGGAQSRSEWKDSLCAARWAPVWECEFASIEPCDATQNGEEDHVGYECDRSRCSWLTFRVSIYLNVSKPILKKFSCSFSPLLLVPNVA